MNYIDQEVQLALNTQFNSSVLSGFGQNFLSPKVVANDPVALTNQMTSLVQQCLQYQISNNSITVGAITASQISSGVVVVQFNYVNNVINQNISYSFLVQ
jgi:intracellular sulfur oxidation DsrE/DsrF family protein